MKTNICFEHDPNLVMLRVGQATSGFDRAHHSLLNFNRPIMKKCPKCNRTYADDGFTFCLEDGSAFVLHLLIRQKKIRSGQFRSSGPSLTAVLPQSGEAAANRRQSQGRS
jgi:hypothetical protein